MKILIIGGMHGNETLGVQLVKDLLRRPIAGVDALYANKEAIDAEKRYTTADLNRSFPGDTQSDGYEQKRAAELLLLAKQYDLVLDFHNTYCSENDCVFVGETADTSLYSVASAVGLSRVIVADYDCINKYASNCVSIEVSMDSPINSVALWRDKITALAAMSQAPLADDIKRYRFAYRMTLEDAEQLKLRTKELKAFTPIEPKLADQMGVVSPAYPIFVNDAFTPYNFGGLLNEL